MLKHTLILLLLGAVAAPASAQIDLMNICNVPKPNVPYPYVDAKVQPCAPSPFGAGTAPTIRTNDSGAMAWWYCKAPNGTWSAAWYVATKAWLTNNPGLFADLSAAIVAPDKVAAFNAIGTKNVALPLATAELLPAFCPFVEEMVVATPAPPPPPALCVIAANGAASTRPAWTLTSAGALAYSSVRAPVGAACACAGTTIGKLNYSTWEGGPDASTVAVCAAKP